MLGKALSGPGCDGGSWENELKVRGFSWTFGAEEEFLSPAWTTKRSLASSGIFSPPAWRG